MGCESDRLSFDLVLTKCRWGGVLAAKAYYVYEDETFLNHAITMWEQYNVWVITPSQIAQGSHPLKGGDLTRISKCHECMFRSFLSAKMGQNTQNEKATNAGALIKVRLYSFYVLHGIDHLCGTIPAISGIFR